MDRLLFEIYNLMGRHRLFYFHFLRSDYHSFKICNGRRKCKECKNNDLNNKHPHNILFGKNRICIDCKIYNLKYNKCQSEISLRRIAICRDTHIQTYYLKYDKRNKCKRIISKYLFHFIFADALCHSPNAYSTAKEH